MRTRLALLVLLIAVLVVPGVPARAAPPPGGELTWSVAPAGPKGPNGRPSLTYKLDPGATITDHVAVTNHSKRPLTLRLYAGDALTTTGGGFDLKADGRPPTDVGSWVRTGRRSVTVAPATQLIIPITVTVPADATPGDHVGGIVASLAAGAADADGNQVTVEHRVGTRIYLRVTGPLRPQLVVTEARTFVSTSWNPLRLPVVTTEFTVRNTGNIRLTAQPSAEVHGLFGVGRRTSAAPGIPEILPGGSVQTRTVTTGVLPLFRMWTTVDARPGGADRQSIDAAPPPAVWSTAFWIFPWTYLALVVVLAGLIAGWVVGRRRRRRRDAEAMREAERRGREQARAELADAG